jgi:hypothetical protein
MESDGWIGGGERWSEKKKKNSHCCKSMFASSSSSSPLVFSRLVVVQNEGIDPLWTLWSFVSLFLPARSHVHQCLCALLNVAQLLAATGCLLACLLACLAECTCDDHPRFDGGALWAWTVFRMQLNRSARSLSLSLALRSVVFSLAQSETTDQCQKRKQPLSGPLQGRSLRPVPLIPLPPSLFNQLTHVGGNGGHWR